jgi:hypothetical protein
MSSRLESSGKFSSIDATSDLAVFIEFTSDLILIILPLRPAQESNVLVKRRVRSTRPVEAAGRNGL